MDHYIITMEREFADRITTAAKSLGLTRSSFIRMACAEKIREMERFAKFKAPAVKTEARREPHNGNGGSDD